MAKKTIEQELLEATGIKASKKESQQDYFKRLHDKVQDFKDDDWDALSDPAQKWVNSAATAIKKGDDIEDFADSAPPADEDDEPAQTLADDDSDGEPAAKAKDDGEEEDDEVRKPAKAAKGKSSKAAKAKPEKTEREKPAKAAKAEKTERKTGPKSSGVKVDIKKAILKDPTSSVEDIMTILKKGGNKPSRPTVAGIRAEFRHSLAVLKSEGHLKSIEL